jgi:lipopolysaccharide/colanic/teichoic acid biosynthesis glycosyltransferase
MGYDPLKRVLDVIGGAVLLALASPVIAVASALVALRIGRPVLFRQARLGRGGTEFSVIKLRTMRDASDANGNPLPDAERLTPLGRALRAASIDELPQLANVLRGDMSLIGPRPLFASYRDLYSAEQQRRHDVRPGLTGLAQVSGRNALSWEQKFALDVWYVDHRSPLLDLRIMLRTVWKLLSRRGVSQPGEATAAVWTGNERRDGG